MGEHCPLNSWEYSIDENVGSSGGAATKATPEKELDTKATGASGAAERVRTGMALVGYRFRKLQNEPILIARLSKYGKYEAAREEE
jgi:hypothetical protein